MEFVVYLYIICLLLVGWSFYLPRGRIYEFPAITTLAFAIFLLPQFIGLYNNSYPVSYWAIELTSAMGIACLIVVWIAYEKFWPSPTLVKKFDFSFSINRLFYCGLVYGTIGSLFFMALGTLPIEDLENSQWTGKTVAYVFFAQLIYPGFALIFCSTLIKPSVIRWSSCILFSFWPLVRFFLFGRRTETAYILCIVFVLLFLIRRYTPPKPLFIIFCLLATIFIHSIGEYRSTVMGNTEVNIFDWKDILQFEWLTSYGKSVNTVDWWSGISQLFTGQKLTELKYAASVIEATQKNFEFGYGARYWNKLIFAYIPSQLVGSDTKQFFYLPNPDFIDMAYQYFGTQTFSGGLTMPVIGELFSQFWLFGPLVYIPLSRFFKFSWIIAKDLNNPIFQVFYALSLPSAGIAIVGGISNLLTREVFYIAFLIPVVLYCRVPLLSSSKGTDHKP